MKRIKNPAIYQIKNNANGKIYIGSAIDYKERWSNHKSALKNCSHHNTHLQNAYNEIGIDFFTFTILEFIELNNLDDINTIKKLLIEKEQYYLNTLLFANQENDLFYKLGYNKRRIAENNLGIKISKEGRLNISKAHIGIKPSLETRMKMSKSIKLAKSKSTYVPSNETRDKLSKAHKGKKLTESHKLSISQNNGNNRMCNQLDKNGNFIKKWNSLALASNELNIIQQHISAVCRGKRTYAGKYKWEYV